jgi:hypothetical protein
MKDAETLVVAALSREAKRLPGLSLDPAPRQGRYVLFDVLWDNPEPGSVHVESYTVDLQSAELWRSIVCERLVDPRGAPNPVWGERRFRRRIQEKH